MNYNCQDSNQCSNHGICLQDNVTCPKTITCICEKCFYGSKCDLTSKGFSVSLDVILGYHIQPLIPFQQQSITVKITAALTMFMFLFGFISGICSMITFLQKEILNIGCGIYLLINSIVSLLTVSLLTIKYWQLVLFQMNLITYHGFVRLNCILIDLLLKSCVSFTDWLNASVAIERAMTTIQGIHFNQLQSRIIAKRIIPVMFVGILISYIHDPLSRRLYDDRDEQRIWCILDTSTKFKIYDRFRNLFHFLIPFVINIVSAIIIIVQVYRTRRTILIEEMKRHQHLLIAPLILILLSIPRLIISFLFGCMESSHRPWLFIIGYYRVRWGNSDQKLKFLFCFTSLFLI